MSNGSGAGAAGSIFLGSAKLLSNVVAGLAVYWGAPLLYEASIASALDHAAQHFPAMVRPYAGLIWAVGCAAAVYALAKGTASTLIVQSAFWMARRM